MTSVVVIEPPAVFVELDLAKAHLRVDHDDDDTLIAAYLAAACAQIDGPDGWLGRAIGLQTLELRQDGFYVHDWRVAGYGSGCGYAWDGLWAGSAWSRWPFSRRIELPCPPFVEVVSITYEDASGADQVLTPGGWQASDEGAEPAFGTGWPSGRIAANAVRIRYRAGYEQTPAPITAAVLLMTADLYANREASVIEVGKGSVITNPTVAALLAPFRVWRV